MAQTLEQCSEVFITFSNVESFFSWQIICDLLELDIIQLEELHYTKLLVRILPYIQSEECVDLLLNSNFAHWNQMDAEGQVPLEMAVSLDLEDIVMKMIKSPKVSFTGN